MVQMHSIYWAYSWETLLCAIFMNVQKQRRVADLHYIRAICFKLWSSCCVCYYQLYRKCLALFFLIEKGEKKGYHSSLS